MVALTLSVSLLLYFGGASSYEHAVSCFQRGQFEATLEALTQLPQEEAGRPAAENLKSLALMKLGRFDAALAANKDATRKDPTNTNYVYNRGLILLTARRLDEAARMFQATLAEFPQSPRLYEGLGDALFQMSRFDETERVLKRWAAIDPKSGAAQAALARLYYALGERKQFAATIQSAIHLDGENYLACYFYGKYLLEDAGRSAEGREYIGRSVQLAPLFEDALIDWGGILTREGRCNEAIDAYERAVASNPARSQTYYVLSLAYRKCGNSTKADWALRQYQNITKDP